MNGRLQRRGCFWSSAEGSCLQVGTGPNSAFRIYQATLWIALIVQGCAFKERESIDTSPNCIKENNRAKSEMRAVVKVCFHTVSSCRRKRKERMDISVHSFDIFSLSYTCTHTWVYVCVCVCEWQHSKRLLHTHTHTLSLWVWDFRRLNVCNAWTERHFLALVHLFVPCVYVFVAILFLLEVEDGGILSETRELNILQRHHVVFELVTLPNIDMIIMTMFYSTYGIICFKVPFHTSSPLNSFACLVIQINTVATNIAFESWI